MKNVFKKHVSLQWANETGFLSRFLTLSYIRATLSKLDRFQNLAEATLQLVTLQLPSYLILILGTVIWLESLFFYFFNWGAAGPSQGLKIRGGRWYCGGHENWGRGLCPPAPRLRQPWAGIYRWSIILADSDSYSNGGLQTRKLCKPNLGPLLMLAWVTNASTNPRASLKCNSFYTFKAK